MNDDLAPGSLMECRCGAVVLDRAGQRFATATCNLGELHVLDAAHACPDRDNPDLADADLVAEVRRLRERMAAYELAEKARIIG